VIKIVIVGHHRPSCAHLYAETWELVEHGWNWVQHSWSRINPIISCE